MDTFDLIWGFFEDPRPTTVCERLFPEAPGPPDREPSAPVREQPLITAGHVLMDGDRIPIPGEEGAPPKWSSEET
jgi:hypothetical protein